MELINQVQYIECEIPRTMKVSELKTSLNLGNKYMVLINKRLAEDGDTISQEDKVIILPLIAGG